jgi:uncharacterized protein (TIGR03437 family)
MSSSFQGDRTTIRKFGLFPVAIVLGFLGYTGTAVAQDLEVSANSISFNTTAGATTPSQTVNLGSVGAPITFTASVGTPQMDTGSLFSVTVSDNTTPATLTVSVNQDAANELSPATYTGTLVIQYGGNSATIPVSLTLGPNSTFITTPTSVAFAAQIGNASPAAVDFTVTTDGSAAAPFTVTASPAASWLKISPATGTVPGTFSATPNTTGLAADNYDTTLFVTSPDGSVALAEIPINMTLGTGPVIAASPNPVIFTVGLSATVPPITVDLVSSDGPQLFTSTTSTGIAFFTLTPPGGTTPTTLTAGLDLPKVAGLAPAITPYVGQLDLTTPDATLPLVVDLYVEVPGSPVTPVNAASGQEGAVSPGEVFEDFGKAIGPKIAAGLQLGSSGNVSSQLGNLQIYFDYGFLAIENLVPQYAGKIRHQAQALASGGAVAAPLFYASANQINAGVPYEVSGQSSVTMVVNNNGTVSEATLSVVPTNPAIFSSTQTGNGQGAILNQDGTVNSANDPAAPGSVVSIYATGEGQLDPPGVTGSVTTTVPPFPKPVAPVSLTIGGQTAQIEYAGEAPGLVSGVLQVNAVIPAGTASGNQRVILTVGNNSNSLQYITVAVQ